MTYSQKQFYERMGAGLGSATLRANQPMDAGYTWTLIDNLAHLIDVSPKYRINFMNVSSNGLALEGPVKEFYFLSQITENGQYPRYDVRVAMYGFTETVINVSLVVPDVFAPVRSADDYGVLGYWSGESPSGGITDYSIEATTGDIDTARCPIVAVPAANFVHSDVAIGYMTMLKLIVEWEFETGEGGFNAALAGVQVREFLVGSE